jgi:hypothetical protein
VQKGQLGSGTGGAGGILDDGRGVARREEGETMLSERVEFRVIRDVSCVLLGA